MSWEKFCDLNNVSRNLRECNLDSRELIPQEKRVLAKKWIENPKKGLMLTGMTGRGKTYFMHCLMRGLLERRDLHALRFFKSKKLDDRLLSDFKQYGSTDYLLQTLKDVPFLFLDDFGIEREGGRPEREYYDLIDERVEHQRPMIISTNLSDANILKTFGDRIHSRLKTCIGIHFDGPDIRETL